jgi:hypothetical protein
MNTRHTAPAAQECTCQAMSWLTCCHTSTPCCVAAASSGATPMLNLRQLRLVQAGGAALAAPTGACVNCFLPTCRQSCRADWVSHLASSHKRWNKVGRHTLNLACWHHPFGASGLSASHMVTCGTCHTCQAHGTCQASRGWAPHLSVCAACTQEEAQLPGRKTDVAAGKGQQDAEEVGDLSVLTH